MKTIKNLVRATICLMICQTACFSPGELSVDTDSKPIALNSKFDVLNLLRQMSGQNILSGQESTYWDQSGQLFPTSRDVTVRSRGGDYPALFATDFGDFHNRNGRNDAGRRSEILEMIRAYHDRGSVIMLSYHICPPDLPDGCGFDGLARPSGYNLSLIHI